MRERAAGAARFEQIFHASPIAMSISRIEDRCVVEVNDAYLKLFGVTAAALLGRTPIEVGIKHPGDLREQVFQQLARGEDVRGLEIGFDTPNGCKRVSLSSRTIDFDGERFALSTFVDNTAQSQLEEQVRQTQKLESLGLLAGGVAHDFNNVLAVIGANAGLLAEVLPPNHPDRELVDEIEAAVRRASSLTRQLLAFSRKEVIEPVVLDVNAAIADTRKMLRRMMGEDIVIETSLEPELHCTRIDPGYFVQILMNLAVNSRDAMPRGGRLSITTRNVGNEVLVEIADSGTGMPPEVVARVFEPFFTTKELGKGTGLGLSVVHGIVQQAGGRITIESRLGAGTAIRIALPVVDAPAERISNVALTALQGSEKILLVDDDVFVRRATSRALRSRGYLVLEAGDAGAALRLLNDHGNDVALLVTDVVMPGTDGRELAIAARRHRPTLDVLYMSGYTDDAMLRHGLEHDQIPFIEKPFRSHVLASKVRHLLDTKAKREVASS